MSGSADRSRRDLALSYVRFAAARRVPVRVPPDADDCREPETFPFCGAALVADCSGALYWPDERALVVADLHLEKGSSYARRGSLLPPYDTHQTLERLAEVLARYRPRTVVALGDSFHDGEGPLRLSAEDRALLASCQRGNDWIWISGNHDPEPAQGLAGSVASELALGPFTFRHEPSADAPAGEVAGHLHPAAIVAVRGRGIRRKCFVNNAHRMILPAFGAYAGGLNVRNRAIARLFDPLAFTVHLVGETRVFALPGRVCLAD